MIIGSAIDLTKRVVQAITVREGNDWRPWRKEADRSDELLRDLREGVIEDPNLRLALADLQREIDPNRHLSVLQGFGPMLDRPLEEVSARLKDLARRLADLRQGGDSA